MWIFCNDAFLSVVVADPDAPGCPGDGKDWMCVRARCPGDLELVFGGYAGEVLEDVGTDYKYRLYVLRTVLQEALHAEVERISYDNFKGSVREHARHDAYLRCWEAMHGLQQRLTRAAHT
jgi:hypothetical protein